MQRVIFLLVLALVPAATLGVMTNARAAVGNEATVALCVGCTANESFEAAAWQAVGPTFVGERDVLVVNPDTGLSRWVFLMHYPPGVSPRAVKSPSAASKSSVEIGRAIGLESDPFVAIYFADEGHARINAVGTSRASVSQVSSAEQATINTAIKVTRKTYFVRLDPGSFPSYNGSLGPEAIAYANFVALQNLGIGWPATALPSERWKALKKALGLYTGRSFVVCDIFGNGDSACFVPNPYDRNLTEQDGPAKNADGNVYPDIGDRVAGGGGDGPVVTRTPSPPEIIYFAPGGGGSGIVCGYVNGKISVCIKQR